MAPRASEVASADGVVPMKAAWEVPPGPRLVRSTPARSFRMGCIEVSGNSPRGGLHWAMSQAVVSEMCRVIVPLWYSGVMSAANFENPWLLGGSWVEVRRYGSIPDFARSSGVVSSLVALSFTSLGMRPWRVAKSTGLASLRLSFAHPRSHVPGAANPGEGHRSLPCASWLSSSCCTEVIRGLGPL